ncbi:gliding motility-associated C-terminal domain-containing protein [Microvirga sp. STS02]|uniref:T9SS type B sorting domain-containing protein n=1 Tax=Hymenobacter negativus TaxID=2795026 RepID=UPI0018DB9E82|nr:MULTISPECIES: gliding motility-associated C-terminal domain-containing protein [Bacteria]MBH8571256.1 gliding motility-associated C-terminal domain-containing protein [Hymenobacter negativus]MBR7210993.1 gliding motility-associated C-terminal domain-containing protein [Microvirga sp. STS02]
MKLLNRYFLLLLLWLPGQLAWSQCETLPNDPTAFVALDANGMEITSFCVGQPVHFVHTRPTTGVLSYGVLRGTGVTFFSSTPRCFPPNYLPYTYTPTLAEVGPVTVSELNNVIGNPIYYYRVYNVYDTPPPAFTVAPCPANQALVTITDTGYDTYTYTFQTPTGSTGSASIGRGPGVIPVPVGATSITLTGHFNTNGSCESRPSVQPITLAAPVKPTLTSLTLSGPVPNGTATLAVGNLPAGYLYTLQVDTGTGFQDVPSITVSPGSPPLSVPNAAAGRYRIARKDYCGGSPDASVAIGTLSLTGASARNRNQLLLDDKGGPGTTYTVTRNGTAITSLVPISGGLEDTDVVCGSTYNYVVTATQPGGGVAISNSFPIRTESSLPPPQPLLVASFNLNNVVVLTPTLATPTLPVGSSLRYSRTAGSSGAVDFGTATSLRVRRDSTDLATLKASPPCYTVRLADTCRNVSPPSSATCPAILSASAADADGSTAALTWTPFTGPDPIIPATYALQRLATDGTVLSSVAVTGNTYTDLTPPTDRQVLRYRLQISGAGLPAGTFSYSNLASVTRQLTLTIPTAFTPNGDGLNDVLEVKGKYLNDYIFVVVDRNGQQVFRGTQRSETWDGTIKGHAPVPGAYVWRFQQDNEDGTPFSATGAVTILK